mmetsp:Transcript_89376/g.208072  ORF Transcript_89376/g.208072 Transcript_89376/m.208072 type:complete len:290 (-) Transcript_89376:33-902(-)
MIVALLHAHLIAQLAQCPQLVTHLQSNKDDLSVMELVKDIPTLDVGATVAQLQPGLHHLPGRLEHPQNEEARPDIGNPCQPVVSLKGANGQCPFATPCFTQPPQHSFGVPPRLMSIVFFRHVVKVRKHLPQQVDIVVPKVFEAPNMTCNGSVRVSQDIEQPVIARTAQESLQGITHCAQPCCTGETLLPARLIRQLHVETAPRLVPAPMPNKEVSPTCNTCPILRDVKPWYHCLTSADSQRVQLGKPDSVPGNRRSLLQPLKLLKVMLLLVLVHAAEIALRLSERPCRW